MQNLHQKNERHEEGKEGKMAKKRNSSQVPALMLSPSLEISKKRTQLPRAMSPVTTNAEMSHSPKKMRLSNKNLSDAKQFGFSASSPTKKQNLRIFQRSPATIVPGAGDLARGEDATRPAVLNLRKSPSAR